MHVFSKIHKFPIQLCFISIMKLKYIHISTQNWHASILAHTRSCHKQIQSVCDWRITPPPLPEECGSYPENYGTPLLYWVPIIEDVPDHSTVRCDTASCSRCWDSQVMNGLKSLNSIFTCTTNDGDNFINFKIYLRIASNNKKAYIEEKLVHVLKTTVIIKDTYFTA